MNAQIINIVIAACILLTSCSGASIVSRNGNTVTITKYPGNFTCFLIESPSGTRIITDPYHIDKPVHTDAITVSHEHLDHNMPENMTGTYKHIDTCGTLAVTAITICGFPGHHYRNDGMRTNIIYVLNLADIRIAQFASQGEPPSENSPFSTSRLSLSI